MGLYIILSILGWLLFILFCEIEIKLQQRWYNKITYQSYNQVFTIQ